MNPPVLLFSSLSSKIALYQSVFAQARKFHPKSKVIGGDSNESCIGASFVQDFLHMPKLVSLDFSALLNFCKSYSITHVIPTRDGELGYWAGHHENLYDHGIHVMNSKIDAINFCADKFRFSKDWDWHKTIQPIPTSLKHPADRKSRFVVKERIDAGSRSVGLNLSADEALEYSRNLRNPIFQPMIRGKELSAETWIDQNGKSHGVLLRWRAKVVNGESHKTTTFENDQLADEMLQIFERIPGLHGHCLAQIIIQPDSARLIVEINPRLGGASPIARHAGLESIFWFLLESQDRAKEIPEIQNFPEGITLTKIGNDVRIS